MSKEQNIANFKRLYAEVFNQGNLDVADELIAPDVVEHQPQPGVDLNAEGPELVRRIATSYRTAFPDLYIAVEDLVAEGDRVVGRITINGTHQGDLMGIPTTSKQVKVDSIDIIRYDDSGKAVEHWGETDSMGLMRQLGIVPDSA